jgi:hypothetical protein
MPSVCKRGRIYRTTAREGKVPEIAMDRVEEFAKDTDYKGYIRIPPGPYSTETMTHVSRSLELIETYGELSKISSIMIGEEDLSLRLAPHIITDKPLTIESDLMKTVKAYKTKYYKETEKIT